MQGKAVVPAHASTEAMQAEKGDFSSLAVDEDGTRGSSRQGSKRNLAPMEGVEE